MKSEPKQSHMRLWVFTVLAVGSIFLGAFLGHKVKSETLGQSVSIELDETRNITRVNFLILGLDGDGTRSDTIMFLSYNNKTKKINLLSIPRDTRVKIGNTYQKINSAIGAGIQEVNKGRQKEPEELPIKKVKEIIKLPIHFFATIDFKGFRNIVDILDGVDFDVPDVEGSGRGMNYDDPYQNLSIHLKPGWQHLDGKKAEQLIRYRKYKEADLARIRTQQQFIKELARQKLRPTYLTKIKPLYEEIKANMRSNYTMFDLAKHIKVIKELKHENMMSFELPGEAKVIGGIWYFLPNGKEVEKMINENFRN